MRHTSTLDEVGARRLVLAVFGLEFPPTLDALKRAYRILAKAQHPDLGGSKEAFQQLQLSYELLTKSPFIRESVESPAFGTEATVDGTPLAELGLGLGPTVNGTDCRACGHHGFTTTFEKKWVICDRCDELGGEYCLECRGTGKFKLRSGRLVECRRCKGSMYEATPFTQHRTRFSSIFGYARSIFDRTRRTCRFCKGSKRQVIGDKSRPVYYRCGDCSGSGEVRIWNPVIPKGRLTR